MPALGFGSGNKGMPPAVAEYLPRAYTASLTPASTATITVAEQTFTVTGLNVGDAVIVNPPSTTAGVGIAGVRVSAANTLAIAFVNPTAGSLTAPSGTYRIIAFKCS